MCEDVPDTLSVVSSSDSFGYRRAHVDDPELLAPLDLVAEGHGIRDDDLAQTAVVEGGDSVAA